MRFAAAALAVAALAGCPDRSISAVEPDPHAVERKNIPVTAAKLDLLFVIDDSGSMDEEQQSLKAHFKDFIGTIAALPSGLPDVHIGVISTDVGTGNPFGGCSADGDDGALLTNGCTGIDGAFLADAPTASGRQTNYTGTLVDRFQCMAELGIGGCGAEAPLEAVRRALDPQNAANAGFLRPDSVLAIVFITDEDDCSVHDPAMFTRGGSNDSVIFGCTDFGITCDEPDLRAPGAKHNCRPRKGSPYLFDVDDYAAFLHDLRPDKETLVIGTIMGQTTCVQIGHPPATQQHDPTAPLLLATSMCAAASDHVVGSATPPIRLDAFRQQFAHQTFVPIGDGDLATALDQIADTLVDTLGNWCIEGTLVDTNLQLDGMQADCVVSDVIHPGTKDEKEQPIAACTPTRGAPCWKIESSDACAAYPSKLRLTIDRGTTAVAADTRVHAQCVVE